jgi:hypothetical protein
LRAGEGAKGVARSGFPRACSLGRALLRFAELATHDALLRLARKAPAAAQAYLRYGLGDRARVREDRGSGNAHNGPMTPTELRCIVAVARERHFGVAAEACFFSQPTPSLATETLEDEPEPRVFERGGSKITVAPLHDEPFMVAVPREHPVAGRKALPAGELERATMLLPGTGPCNRDQVLVVRFAETVPTRRVVPAWRRSAIHCEAIAALRNAIFACPLQGVRRLSV